MAKPAGSGEGADDSVLPIVEGPAVGSSGERNWWGYKSGWLASVALGVYSRLICRKIDRKLFLVIRVVRAGLLMLILM